MKTDNESTNFKYLKDIKLDRVIISLVNISIMAIGFSLLIFVLSLITKV